MKALALLLVLMLFLAFAPQPAAAQPPAPSTTSRSPQHETTAYTLPPDKLAKSAALYNLRFKLRMVDTVWGLVMQLGLLYFGIAAKFRDIAEKGSRFRFVQALIFVPLLLIFTAVLQLPLDAYRQSISLQYGLSVQHWGSWLGDQFLDLLVTSILLTPVAWIFTALIRKSPRRWWLYAGLCAIPFVVFVIFITPIIIDPLFNKYEPLDKTNPELVTAIQQVTRRGGIDIPRDRMFLMRASEKVTTLNASFNGFGPSKRVVVWDTTLKYATTPELLFVFGHEMGHYVLNHVVIGIAATAIGLLVGFYLLYRIANCLFPYMQQRWRMRELSDWASLVMLVLIFSTLSTVSQPIVSGFNRRLEHNADIYGLEITHGINANSREVAAHTFQVMGELSLSYPYPNRALVFWYADHPPLCDRVPLAQSYDPWSKGGQPKYVK